MLKLLILAFVACAVIGFMPQRAEAAGVKITEQNVKDVCGSGLQENTEAGVKGCTKKCGLNGEHTCDFSCIGNKCEGVCVSCGVKVRRVTYKNRAAAALANKVISSEIGARKSSR